tara:strand:- start:1004 stop:1339 length:336 start_codon:yes stop_codon:yes gene_type:complete
LTVAFALEVILTVHRTTWRTIDKGLESLPRAFLPHVQNKTTFGRFVSGLTYIPETDKIAVNWRDADDKFAMQTKSAEFDYAVVAAPFSKVRLWRTPRKLKLPSPVPKWSAS